MIGVFKQFVFPRLPRRKEVKFSGRFLKTRKVVEFELPVLFSSLARNFKVVSPRTTFCKEQFLKVTRIWGQGDPFRK
jgi:hypothetical protein